MNKQKGIIVSVIKNKKIILFTIICVFLFVSVLFNGFLFWKLNNIQTYFNNPPPQSALQLLLEEYTVLIVNAAESGNTNTARLKVIKQELEKNAAAIAVLVGKKYGQDAQYEFQRLWMSQAEAYLGYTLAAKNRDNKSETNALRELTSFPNKFTNFFVKLNPKMQGDALRVALGEYVATIKTVIDSDNVNDYATRYKHQHNALITAYDIATIFYTWSNSGLKK